jgi:hypothetical protein
MTFGEVLPVLESGKTVCFPHLGGRWYIAYLGDLYRLTVKCWYKNEDGTVEEVKDIAALSIIVIMLDTWEVAVEEQEEEVDDRLPY